MPVNLNFNLIEIWFNENFVYCNSALIIITILIIYGIKTQWTQREYHRHISNIVYELKFDRWAFYNDWNFGYFHLHLSVNNIVY